MSGIKDKTSTRRAFFLSGGAVRGAGVATTVGAAAPKPADSHGAPGASADDREAIRQLHLAHMARLENGGAEAAAGLFGEPGRMQLGAYRQSTSQQNDRLTFSEDGQRATATFHCEVELCTPLEGDCTAAQMARLQGLTASRRWESGRFEASYVKTRGQWQTESLRYVTA